MKKPFINRIFLWSLERFPPIQVVSAFLTFAIVTLPLVQPDHLMQTLCYGTWIVWSILLVLRVLDEHKDYESDLVAHPERRLQKGELSLSDLRKVAFFFSATSFLLIVVIALRVQVLIALGALIFWIFLMTKEFFVHRWLFERLFLYSVSHLLVSPFLIYFSATLVGTQNNANIIFMMAISFFSAFSYEVARKIKGTDEENLKEMNYVNAYGVRGPVFLFFVVSCLALLSSTYLVELTNIKIGIYLFAVVYVFIAALLFYKNPQKKFRKLNEAAAAAVGLISFLIPLSKMIYG